MRTRPYAESRSGSGLIVERGRLVERRAPDGTIAIDIGHLGGWLRRGLLLIILMMIIGAVGGFAFATLMKPSYTVSTDILVDPSNLRVVQDDLFPSSGQNTSQMFNVDSKVRVLTSRNVLERVVSRLGLANDEEFVDTTPSFLASLLGKTGPTGRPEDIAVMSLAEHIKATRDERSFVVTLAVSSEDPQKAIRISDAIAKAFQEELALAESEGAARTAESLNGRLAVLQEEVHKAEEAVASFKNEHGLQSSGNELASTREMTDLNALKVAAQGRLIEARARYEALVSDAADPNGNTAVLQSETIAALKAQQALLVQRGADVLNYGPRHPERLALERQLADIKQAIDAETKRIVEAAKTELDQAEATLAALTARAEDSRSVVATDTGAEVRLRALERDAAAKASVYEAYLARAREITERERLDTTNIRVISTAVPPTKRSWPPSTSISIAAGALCGLALGALFVILGGLARDMRRVQRSVP
ncbi:MAG: GumC family protein [Bauldia sp.]|uniref:GumC family protein n=1 Tax=Bauldia sp. TaxID=2575872 RepID=UPI001D52B9D2|nr:GumC family protein [Bauldia sp.]MCB1494707.1 GumC family protein [Bauldia sp.]